MEGAQSAVIPDTGTMAQLMQAKAASAFRIDADAISDHVGAELRSMPPPVEPKPLGKTLGEMLAMPYVPRNEVLPGLAARENGLLVAPTNKGKTSFMRNLAIAKACGIPFGPFSLPGADPIKVAYADFEDDPSYKTLDLRTMIQMLTPRHQELVKQNLKIYCDESVNNEPLQLSNPEHFLLFAEDVAAFGAALTLIDTVARAFSVPNENDNAAVKELVMIPKKRLAVLTESAVLGAHHIGKAKSEEGQTRELAHAGRGASTFGDLSRAIYKLEADTVNDTLTVVCAKIKGRKFEDQTFRLNPLTRWFGQIEAAAVKTGRDYILELFGCNGVILSTAQVVDSLKGKGYSERSAKDFLKRAAEGDIIQLKRGLYQGKAEGSVEVQLVHRT